MYKVISAVKEEEEEEEEDGALIVRGVPASPGLVWPPPSSPLHLPDYDLLSIQSEQSTHSHLSDHSDNTNLPGGARRIKHKLSTKVQP